MISTSCPTPVVDLIHQNRHDEALAVCDQLQRKCPEVLDGLERAAIP